MICAMRPIVEIVPLLCATALALPPSTPAQTGITAGLPNGRQIHPAGNWIPLAPYPFALSVRSGGGQIAVPSIGFPFALNVIDQPAPAQQPNSPPTARLSILSTRAAGAS
jgi:hypothetical protein